MTRGPFPGMDPWLERYWEDVHHRLVQYASDQLQPRLPGDLFASIERTVYILGDDWTRSLYRPDVTLLRVHEQPGVFAAGGVAEPVRVRRPDRQVRLGSIEIRDLRDDRALVTAVEVISPVNKVDRRGRRRYMEKRDAYEQADVNVVEIDLLRAGPHVIDVPPELFAEAPRLDTAYKCCVRRAGQHGSAWVDYYPLPLRERLPRIPIPLRAADTDVPLDLQALIDLAYVNGRYAVQIDYSEPADPPLCAEDALWAQDVLRVAAP